MNDHRIGERELSVGVSAFVYRADGSVLEGVVQDASAGGIKISGDPTGLRVGDRVDVVVVLYGDKVRFACEVRHLAPSKQSFGLLFHSGPQAVDESGHVRRCMKCRRDYSTDCNYCSHCGQKLVTR